MEDQRQRSVHSTCASAVEVSSPIVSRTFDVRQLEEQLLADVARGDVVGRRGSTWGLGAAA